MLPSTQPKSSILPTIQLLALLLFACHNPAELEIVMPAKELLFQDHPSEMGSCYSSDKHPQALNLHSKQRTSEGLYLPLFTHQPLFLLFASEYQHAINFLSCMQSVERFSLDCPVHLDQHPFQEGITPFLVTQNLLQDEVHSSCSPRMLCPQEIH